MELEGMKKGEDNCGTVQYQISCFKYHYPEKAETLKGIVSILKEEKHNEAADILNDNLDKFTL